MRKDISRSTSSGREEQLPISRRSSLFSSPWSEDYLDPVRMFDRFFNRDLSAFTENNRSMAPAIDVDETNDAYIVCADLPGVKKEDVSIECSGNQLTISAERKYETPEGGKNGRRERFYGSYQRSFTLPSGVDADKIAATFEGGELKLQIPKGEQARSRKIEIGEKKNKKEEVDPQQETVNRH